MSRRVVPYKVDSLEVISMTHKVRPAAVGGGWIAAIAVVSALAGCTSLRVSSDVNPALAGAVQCHTFAWAGSFHGSSPLRTTIANPLNESRLREAIAANLQSKGLQPVSGDAECLVGYGIGTQNVIDGPYPVGWGWGGGGGWGRRGWGGGWGYYDYPYVYEQGVVAVDLYDSKTKQPIWHASVGQNLAGATGADAQKKIDAAVAALFTKYPVSAPGTRS
jgi:hypothetical protein